MPTGARPERALSARALGVRFAGAPRAALADVDLDVSPGEVVCVLGPSGCGKSTLLQALLGAIPDLVPAIVTGTVAWGSDAPGPPSIAASRFRAALVQQDSDAALVCLTVADEIAFALESRALAPATITARVGAALAEGPGQGLAPEAATLALSGGWRQRLAWAAALAEQAPVLLLDEPLAHLDPDATRSALAAIALARDRGAAIVLVEHRADLAEQVADTAVIMGRDGRVALRGPSRDVFAAVARCPDGYGLRLSPAARAAGALRSAGLFAHEPSALSVSAIRAALKSDAGGAQVGTIVRAALGLERQGSAGSGDVLVRLVGAGVRRSEHWALQDTDVDVRAAEVLGVAGRNGAGKTTLALLLAGGLRARTGRAIRATGPTPVLVPQNPSLAFTGGDLGEEARRRGLDWTEVAARLEAAGLPTDATRNPLRFSQGERRRIALALAAAGSRPRLVVLDEPQSGLDGPSLVALTRDIGRLRDQGHGVVVVSHDLDWLAEVTDHLLIVDSGRVILQGPTSTVLDAVMTGRTPLSPPPMMMLLETLRPAAGVLT
jgi:energy-coupling factor transporter ATP-binding protein EcfA2